MKLYRYFLLVPCLALSFISSSCQNAARSQASSPFSNENSQAQLLPRKEATEYGGTEYIRANGWPLPELGQNISDVTSIDLASNTGQIIRCQVSDYSLNPFIISNEPFDQIDYGFKLIQIRDIRIFSYKGKAFSYRIQFNSIRSNPNDNKSESVGVVSFFSYYDNDGDGKFESLVLGELDQRNISSFSSLPHIPAWVKR